MSLTVASPTAGTLQILGAMVIGTVDGSGNFVQYTGGGSSSSQLPAWTYTAGTIGAGLLTTNNGAFSSTTVITLSQTVLGGYVEAFSKVAIGSFVVFTDSAGLSIYYRIEAITDDGSDNSVLAVEYASGALYPSNWSGKYTASFGMGTPIQQLAGALFLTGGGAPTSGTFTTDNAAIGSTTTITLSSSVLGTIAAVFSNGANPIQPNLRLIVADMNGVFSTFAISSVSDSGGNIAFTVVLLKGSGNWFGPYQFSFLPVAQTAASVGALATDGSIASTTGVNSDITAAIAAAIAAMLADSSSFAALQAAAGITPVADGTVTPVTSITTVKGNISAAS